MTLPKGKVFREGQDPPLQMFIDGAVVGGLSCGHHLIRQKSEIFATARAPFVCFADIFPANGEIYPSRGRLLRATIDRPYGCEKKEDR